MKLLSVSIAAYNVEAYINQAVKSIAESAVADYIEVLIVDDGSTDCTASLSQSLESEYPGIVKYIKKKNGGHGSTINSGFANAHGVFFKVLDGDDWLDERGLCSLIEVLKNTDADLVLSAYREVRVKDGEKLVDPNSDYREGEIYKISFNPAPHVWLTTSCIRTSKLRQVYSPLPENCFYVDILYNMMCVLAAENFTVTHAPVYEYRLGLGGQSVSKKNMIKNIEMQERVAKKACQLFYMHLELIKFGQKIEPLRIILTQSVGSVLRTYLLLNASERRCRLARFKNAIICIHPDLMQVIDRDRFIRFMLSANSLSLSIMSLIYKMYLNTKSK